MALIYKYQQGGKQWGEMSIKERTAYLDNKDAENKSRKQAKKEHTEEYILKSTKEALTHPMFSAPAYFTPQGAIIGGAQSIMNAGKNVSEGNYKTAALDLIGALPLVKTVTKNISKLNPKSFKVDKDSWYRIVGKDAADDMLKSNLVRSKPKSDVKTNGINLQNRPTAYPSFSKGEISHEYAKGLPEHYLISTKREGMAASTLGRHGKGTTQFPTNKEGNFISEFPADEAKLYKPHWWKGYKEVTNQPAIPTEKLINKSTLLPSKINSELSEDMIPFISKITPTFTKEEKVFNSFLSPEGQYKKVRDLTKHYDKNGNLIKK